MGETQWRASFDEQAVTLGECTIREDSQPYIPGSSSSFVVVLSILFSIYVGNLIPELFSMWTSSVSKSL